MTNDNLPNQDPAHNADGPKPEPGAAPEERQARVAEARAALEDLHHPGRYLGPPAQTAVAFGLNDEECLAVITDWRAAHGIPTDRARCLLMIQRARREAERDARRTAPETPVPDGDYIASTANDPPKLQYPTGSVGLDVKTGGGLKSGQPTLLIGPTGAGKTAEAQNIAVNAARAGTPVVFIECELTKKMTVQRYAAIASGGDVTIRDLEFGDARRTAVTVSKLLKGLPLYTFSLADMEDVDDPIAFVEARAKEVEALTKRKPLVIVDYLQDFARTSEEAVRMTVGALSRKIRIVATRNNWAILVLSSTSRNNYLRSDKPISLEPEDYKAFAKESGDLEFDAGHLLVLITMPREEGKATRDAFIMSAKERGGESGAVGFVFDGATGIFREDPKALERIQQRSAATQSRAHADKREAILAAVAGGAKTKSGIFAIVKGSKPQVFKRIAELIAAGDLVDHGLMAGGITIGAAKVATPAPSNDNAA